MSPIPGRRMAWSDNGAWSSGFWPGMLWLAEAATGERRFAALAAESAQRLRSRTGAPTVLRGFCLVWRGNRGGARPCPARAGRARDRGGAVPGSGLRPGARLLPPGGAGRQTNGGRGRPPDDGARAVRCWLRRRPHRRRRLRDIALAHARGHLALCMRADGSVAQSATYDHQGRPSGEATIEGSSRDSTWARAQAWEMLGLAQAAHWPARSSPASQARWRMGLGTCPRGGACGISTITRSRTRPATRRPRRSSRRGRSGRGAATSTCSGVYIVGWQCVMSRPRWLSWGYDSGMGLLFYLSYVVICKLFFVFDVVIRFGML